MDFSALKNRYEAYGLTCSEIQTATESAEYAAATFLLNNQKIIFRASKVTPTKTGQFVTVWKRNEDGITTPFESTDSFDFIIIASEKDSHSGQFIFPRSVLLDRGVISGNKEGKRGIRVYPLWDQAENKQAQKTQQWQLNYFVDFSLRIETVTERITALLQH